MKWIATIITPTGGKKVHRFNAYTEGDARREAQAWKRANGYRGKTKLKEDKQ